MLTRAQKRLLDFLKSYIAENGYGPSYEDMCVAIGLKNKSGVARLLDGLEKRGFIRRMPNLARAIEVVDRVQEAQIARARQEGFDQGYRACLVERGLALVGRAA